MNKQYLVIKSVVNPYNHLHLHIHSLNPYHTSIHQIPQSPTSNCHIFCIPTVIFINE